MPQSSIKTTSAFISLYKFTKHMHIRYLFFICQLKSTRMRRERQHQVVVKGMSSKARL